MKYVIIGASAAGIQAAQDLRNIDGKAEITVISKEPYAPYSRCLLSRFIDGRLPESALYYKTGDFFKTGGIEGLTGEKVVGVDRFAKKIRTDKDRSLAYDRLLIAAGARPRVPSMPGTGLEGVFSLHGLDDALGIIKRAKEVKEAVVAGAGFVGLEAAWALAKRGLRVTVVEKCQQILPNQLDRTAGSIIQKDLEEAGVNFVLDESLTEAGGCDAIESVTLADNSDLRCGLLILATGIRPETDLALGAGLKTDRGIIVDDHLRTSFTDIWAAGDCIEIEDVSTGRRSTSATWFNAVLQGKYAAYNMAGLNKRYTGSVGIQNAVQFHSLPAISFGKTQVSPEDGQDYKVLSVKRDRAYKKLVLKGDRIVGMIFVGDISRSGFYAALIRNGIDIKVYKDKLLDPDFSYAHFKYAYFKQEDFGQYDPYFKTAECWDHPEWWELRGRCMLAEGCK